MRKSQKKKSQRKKRNPNLNQKLILDQSALLSAMTPTKLYSFLIAAAAIQIGLEYLWMVAPERDYLQLHTSILAGMLDNIIPAFIIYYLINRRFIILKLIALIWFAKEVVDGLIRLVIHYTLHTGQFELTREIYDAAEWVEPIYLLTPFAWLAYHYKNFTNRRSDKITKHGTFLVFIKPWSTLTLFLTLGINPYSSVSIVHRNKVFYFTKESHRFVKQNIRPALFENSYTMAINPPANFGHFLNRKVDTRYHWRKNSCVSVMKGSGIPIGPLDFIPAIFIMRFTK